MIEPISIDEALGPLPASPLRDRIKGVLEILVAEAVAAENEACALIADQVAADAAFDPSRELAAERIADAIRARARKEKTE